MPAQFKAAIQHGSYVALISGARRKTSARPAGRVSGAGYSLAARQRISVVRRNFFDMAISIGVSPALLRMRKSAPCWINICVTSEYPFSAASSIGAVPS